MIEQRDQKAEAAALEWLKTELIKTPTSHIEKAIPAWWKDDSWQEGSSKHPIAEKLNSLISLHFGFEFSDIEWKKIILDYLKSKHVE